MEKEILCASGYDFEAILRLAGRKMRNDYKNGKVSKSVILAKIARDKKEADAFSLYGYRRHEIICMLKETHNRVLQEKLQDHLANMTRVSQKSADQNRTSLDKLERFKKEACGIGLRKVIKKMDAIARKTKDRQARLVLLLLETEYANLSAKQHRHKKKKDKIYERKDILLLQMADYLDKLHWKYGINDETGKNADHIVYVYLPNGVQLSWHCNGFSIYQRYPPIDAQWDGQVCMTMEKILAFIEKNYLKNQVV